MSVSSANVQRHVKEFLAVLNVLQDGFAVRLSVDHRPDNIAEKRHGKRCKSLRIVSVKFNQACDLYSTTKLKGVHIACDVLSPGFLGCRRVEQQGGGHPSEVKLHKHAPARSNDQQCFAAWEAR